MPLDDQVAGPERAGRGVQPIMLAEQAAPLIQPVHEGHQIIGQRTVDAPSRDYL